MRSCYFDGTCGATDPECPLVQSQESNARDWQLNDHCATYKTLVVAGDTPFLNGQGQYSLTLVAGPTSGVWEGGRAGITNETGGVRVTDMTIIVDGVNVANGTCTGSLDDPTTIYGTVVAAVSINPYRNGFGLPRPAVTGVTVRVTGGAQLCNGLEFGGGSESSLMTDDLGYRASTGFVGNTIEAGAYSQYGLLMQYVDFRDDPDEALVTDNFVVSSANACAGIKVGPLVERLDISGNTVFAPGGCSGGAGIDIDSAGVPFDDGLGHVLEDYRPIVMAGNTVDTASVGATTAIRIRDSAVDANESNAITCTGTVDVTYDVATTVGLSFPNNRKKQNTANEQRITTANQTCPRIPL